MKEQVELQGSRAALTLQRGSDNKGLLKTMQELGVTHASPGRDYKGSFLRKLERGARQWSDEGSKKVAIERSDVEGFINEFVKDCLWWDTAKELLCRTGFPMNEEGDRSRNIRPEHLIMSEFENLALMGACSS